jgi:O-antigen/teichoic acid export membrane protein
VMIVLIGVPLVAMISFPLPAMLHALNRTNVPLVANVIGVIVYVAAIFPFVQRLGLVGAGLAFLIGRVAMALFMAVVLASERRRLRSLA